MPQPSSARAESRRFGHTLRGVLDAHQGGAAFRRESGTVLPPRLHRAVKTLEPSAHTTVGAKPDLCRSVLLSMASLALIEQGYVEVIGQHHSTCKLRFLLTGEIPEGATESIYGHGEHIV